MASIVRIKEIYNIPSKRKMKCNSNNNQSIKGASYALKGLRHMIGSSSLNKRFKLNLNGWRNPYSIATDHNRLVTNSHMKGAGPTDNNAIRYKITEDQRAKAAIYNLARLIHC